ncbi:hypothetical protein BH11BAC2_BH11BAC2_22030 [soil metagenome]
MPYLRIPISQNQFPSMRKLLYSLVVLLIIHVNVKAQDNAAPSGIIFQDLTYEQAIAKSKAENKPVFLHGFAAWCHYCEYMKDSIYPDAEVGKFYNAHFICIKLDMEKEGKDLNKRLKITSFPTYVWFDGSGDMIHRVGGRRYKADFLKIGAEAIDSTKQFRTFDKKFKAGLMSPDEAGNYFRMIAQGSMDNQETINGYLLGIPDDKFTDAPYWKIINDYFRDVNQPAMGRVLARRKDFAAKYGADSVDNRILNNYNSALMQKVQRLDSIGYDALIAKIKSSKIDLADKIAAYADMNKMKMKSKWTEYLAAAPAFIDTYCKDDHRRLNEVAFVFYERTSDTLLLKKAEDWAKEAVKLNDNYKYNHTLASLAYRLGDKDLALKTGNHALELANATAQDAKTTKLLLEKVNELK